MQQGHDVRCVDEAIPVRIEKRQVPLAVDSPITRDRNDTRRAEKKKQDRDRVAYVDVPVLIRVSGNLPPGCDSTRLVDAQFSDVAGRR